MQGSILVLLKYGFDICTITPCSDLWGGGSNLRAFFTETETQIDPRP